MIRILLIVVALSIGAGSTAQKVVTTGVLVVGGGVGGTAAGIQSARLGVNTMIAESSSWLGGMISAAGVSATDGNHHLPSGIWAEFRNQLYAVYGGPAAVATGWVSHTQFEPHVADSIFKRMAGKERLLTVMHHYQYSGLQKRGNRIVQVQFRHKKTGASLTVVPKMVIDATELGDVIKDAGVSYDLGMEADSSSGEKAGVAHTSNIVQDLTYVAILKDYGRGADRTIPKPAGYDPAEFDGACTDYYHNKNRKAPTVDAKKMLDYGKLPHNKYMINWPNYGNDTYLNIIELTEAQREQELQKAKQTTLRFVYFIQQQLGFKNLGLDAAEFPTEDRLALMPYHRESRRIKGLVRFTMRHIAEPFTYGDPLYRTGISVGDYPIDHHHKKNEEAPQHLDFYPIPSYNIPLGALIPHRVDNLIVAEKSISVSNVANGTTRLQPVVMLTGQAAGALAALSVKKSLSPKDVPVRTVQETLLRAKAYLMPYIDVKPEHPHFEAVQKMGATGILKGKGVPFQWANQTWFYPDSVVKATAFNDGIREMFGIDGIPSVSDVTISEATSLAALLYTAYSPPAVKRGPKNFLKKYKDLESAWYGWGLKAYNPERPITRLELAVLFHHTLDPFSLKAVNHKGFFTPSVTISSKNQKSQL